MSPWVVSGIIQIRLIRKVGESMTKRIQTLELTGEKPSSKFFIEYWNSLKSSNKSNIGTKRSKSDISLLRRNSSLIHWYVTLFSDRKMEVISYGKGKPLLFLSGLGVTAPIWLNQINEFGRDYQVIIIHLPGHGLSETTSDFSYQGISQIIYEVLQILEIGEPIHVVGACVGGNIAITFVEMYQQYISSLTLVNAIYEWKTTAFDEGPLDKERVKSRMLFLSSFEQSLTQDFIQIMKHISQPSEANYKKYYEMHEKSKSIDPYAYIQYVIDISKNKRIDDMARRVERPTMIIAGSKDSAVDFRNSQVLSQLIMGAEFVEISGAGHFPYITHPEAFNKILRNFIQSHDDELQFSINERG